MKHILILLMVCLSLYARVTPKINQNGVGAIRICDDDTNVVSVSTTGALLSQPVSMIDSTTGALVYITNQHHEIHEGEAYYLLFNDTLGDGDSLLFRFAVPNTVKRIHMEIYIDAIGETDFMLYEGTTKRDTVARRVSLFNRNRNSTDTSIVVACYTPVDTGLGKKIAEVSFGIDTGSGAKRILSGGGTQSRQEFILKNNTAYLIRIKSGTAANKINVLLDWYELN